jgi:FtsZ-interacting cell division protein ZipA
MWHTGKPEEPQRTGVLFACFPAPATGALPRAPTALSTMRDSTEVQVRAQSSHARYKAPQLRKPYHGEESAIFPNHLPQPTSSSQAVTMNMTDTLDTPDNPSDAGRPAAKASKPKQQSRVVSLLTPEQLARKRAQDRESQRQTRQASTRRHLHLHLHPHPHRRLGRWGVSS